MKTNIKTKQVFLSYARNDNSLANALSKELQRRGFKVWDDQSIMPGIDWNVEITKALKGLVGAVNLEADFLNGDEVGVGETVKGH